MSKSKIALIVIFFVLICDQFLKLWVKTHMTIGDEFNVLGSWFKIHFIENYGMAFGFEFGGEFGKIALSIFRLIAISLIGVYISRLCKQEAHTGFIASVALIFAGALGNMIDSAFYGLFFSDSYHQLAVFLPETGGYAGFLHGWVVDMLYFPLFHGAYPHWFPFVGGQPFLFFRPVFNIADSSIFIGVVSIILFQHKFFPKKIKTDSHEI